MRFGIISAAFMSASLVFGGAARAQEQVLTFGSGTPPTVHITVGVFGPWAKRVTEQGKGVVRVEMRDQPAIASVANMYSRVLDNVVNIGWSCTSFTAGKFPRSDLLSLPFITEDSEAASVAFWRLYKSGALDAEFDEIKPLMLVQAPQTLLHARRPLQSLDTLAGLKFGSQTRFGARIVQLLGGTPLAMPVTDMYEALQRGTMDGVLIAWSGFPPYKLGEVTSYHVEAAFGGTPCMVFMSKKKFDSLPQAARAVIEQNAMENESRVFGAFWDKIAREGRDSVKGTTKHTIVEPGAEQLAKWRERVSPVVDEWAKSTPNGEELLAQFRQTFAEVQTGK